MRIETSEDLLDRLLRPVFEKTAGVVRSTRGAIIADVTTCTYAQLAEIYEVGDVVVDEDGRAYDTQHEIMVSAAYYEEAQYVEITLSRRPPVAN